MDSARWVASLTVASVTVASAFRRTVPNNPAKAGCYSEELWDNPACSGEFYERLSFFWSSPSC